MCLPSHPSSIHLLNPFYHTLSLGSRKYFFPSSFLSSVLSHPTITDHRSRQAGIHSTHTNTAGSSCNTTFTQNIHALLATFHSLSHSASLSLYFGFENIFSTHSTPRAHTDTDLDHTLNTPLTIHHTPCGGCFFLVLGRLHISALLNCLASLFFFFFFSSILATFPSTPAPGIFISHSIAKYTHVHPHFTFSHIRKFLKGVTGGLDSPAIDILKRCLPAPRFTPRDSSGGRWLTTDEKTPQL